MERHIAIFESDGRFTFPPDVKQELGIEPGSQYQVTTDKGQIHLNPLEASETPREKQPSIAERPIDRLRAMFAGGPSLEDELLEWRRSGKW